MLFWLVIVSLLFSFSTFVGAKLDEIKKKNKNFTLKMRFHLSVLKKTTNFAPHFAKNFGTNSKNSNKKQ